METTTVLLVTLLLSLGEVRVVHLKGTVAQCLEIVTARKPDPGIQWHCIAYDRERGAVVPKHVLRAIGKMQVGPAAPVRTDEIPATPRG